MKLRRLFVLSIIAALGLQMQFSCLAVDCNNGELSKQEFSEVVRMFIGFSGKTPSELVKCMDELTLDQKILLNVAIMIYTEEMPDEYFNNAHLAISDSTVAFDRACAYAIHYGGNQRRAEDGSEYSEKMKAYFDQYCSRVLEMIREDINGNVYSDKFICLALEKMIMVEGLPLDRRHAYASDITSLMNICKRISIRRALYGSMPGLYRSEISTEMGRYYEDLINDSDSLIAHRALLWMVEHGHKELLPKYVRLSWELYSKYTERKDSTMDPCILINLEGILSEMIPASKMLISKEQQLEWLSRNLDQLQYCEADGTYMLKTRGQLH
jgi:hypothetical protein